MIRAALALMVMTQSAGAAPAPASVQVGGPPGTICEVTLAHWYVLRFHPSVEGEIVLPFRLDQASETVSVLSEQGIEMAVEGLLCGPETDLQTSGQRLDFRRLAKLAQSSRAPVACRMKSSGVAAHCKTAADGN